MKHLPVYFCTLGSNVLLRIVFTLSPYSFFRVRGHPYKPTSKSTKVGRCGLDASGSGPAIGTCEDGNETLGSIKDRDFLTS
jgi:hypothetical protein